MRRRELELTLDLESDSEEDDLYDTVGQDVGDCSHIQAPSNVEKTSRIKEVMMVMCIFLYLKVNFFL